MEGKLTTRKPEQVINSGIFLPGKQLLNIYQYLLDVNELQRQGKKKAVLCWGRPGMWVEGQNRRQKVTLNYNTSYIFLGVYKFINNCN